MDLQNLKIAAEVARSGSFAAAARALDLDPSAVSRVVASLEAELGLRLFQRTTRKLSVTEEGSTYLHRIAPLLEEFDRAREEAAQQKHALSGRLRLTASIAFTQECIMPLVPEFCSLHPDLEVEFLPTDSNLDLVENGIDLAIRLAATPSGDLVSTKILDTQYHVVATPDWADRHDRPDQPAELAGHDCLRFSLPGFRDRWLFRDKSGTETAVTVKGRIIASSALTLKQAAISGLGPALLPNWLVRHELEDGTLVQLFPEHRVAATDFDTGAYALFPSRSYLPRKVRVTIDFLRSRLRAHRQPFGGSKLSKTSSSSPASVGKGRVTSLTLKGKSSK